jgi:hypothetical protein
VFPRASYQLGSGLVEVFHGMLAIEGNDRQGKKVEVPRPLAFRTTLRTSARLTEIGAPARNQFAVVRQGRASITGILQFSFSISAA